MTIFTIPVPNDGGFYGSGRETHPGHLARLKIAKIAMLAGAIVAKSRSMLLEGWGGFHRDGKFLFLRPGFKRGDRNITEQIDNYFAEDGELVLYCDKDVSDLIDGVKRLDEPKPVAKPKAAPKFKADITVASVGFTVDESRSCPLHAGGFVFDRNDAVKIRDFLNKWLDQPVIMPETKPPLFTPSCGFIYKIIFVKNKEGQFSIGVHYRDARSNKPNGKYTIYEIPNREQFNDLYTACQGAIGREEVGRWFNARIKGRLTVLKNKG